MFRPPGPVPKLQSSSEAAPQPHIFVPQHPQPPQPPQPPPQPPLPHPSAPSPWANTRTLCGHAGAVLCLRLNASGSHLLTGGQDRTVRLWNPRKADPATACLATFRDGRLSHPVADIAVLPGSRQFATCGGTTQALLWDLKTKQLVRKMSGHSLRVNCVAEGAQGSVLVTGGYDRSVCVHDLRSRGTIQTMERCCRDSVESVCVAGKEIIAASADGHVYVFDVAAGKLRVDGYHAPIGFIAPSRHDGGRTLLLSCQGGVGLCLTERATGLVLGRFRGAHRTTDFKIGCAFLDRGRMVCTGSETGDLVVYDTLSERAVHRLCPEFEEGARGGGGSGGGAEAAWEARRTRPPEQVAVATLAASRDFGFLAAGSYDGSVRIWEHV
jgi:mitogen-activated protein kinase organizer 1